jgi:hypothetical protein
MKKNEIFTMDNLRASTFVDKTFATGEGYSEENQKKAVALPCRGALKKWVKLILPGYGETIVQCLDVGPYFWWDDDFIYKCKRPLVESYFYNKKHFPSERKGSRERWDKVSFRGKIPSSRASVDLTPPVWKDLGVTPDILKNEFNASSYKMLSVNNMIMEWFVDPKESEIPEWLDTGFEDRVKK